jgi:hypothetical protein
MDGLHSLDDLPGALTWAQATRVRLHTNATLDLLVDTAFAVYGALMPSWSAEAGEALTLTTTRTRTGWRVRAASSTQGLTLRISRSSGSRAVRQARTALALIIAGSDWRRAEAFARAWGVRMWSCEAPGCSRRFFRRGVWALHERAIHHLRPTAVGMLHAGLRCGSGPKTFSR